MKADTLRGVGQAFARLAGVACALAAFATATASAATAFSVTPGPALTTARTGHHAITLDSGRVLLIGGHGQGFSPLGSNELSDAALAAFTALPSQTHDGACLARLDDGSLLVAGSAGSSGASAYAHADRFDPATLAFTATTAMATRRSNCSAAALDNGQALVLGGWYTESSGNAERFARATGTFTATGPLLARRAIPLLVPVQGGRVLVIGGMNPDDYSYHDSIELFDAASNRFASHATQIFPGESGWRVRGAPLRRENTLSDGRILHLAHRVSGSDVHYRLFTVDPGSLAITALTTTPALPSGYYWLDPVVDGARQRAYLIGVTAGSAGSAAVFHSLDLASHALSAARPLNLASGVYLIGSSLNLLPDGRLLLAGGTARNDAQTNFNPIGNTWLITPDRDDTAPEQSFALTATASGSLERLTLDLALQVASADIAAAGSIYLGAWLPQPPPQGTWFFHNGSGWSPWSGASIPAHFTGALPARRDIPVLRDADARPLAGLRLYGGYGASPEDMLRRNLVREAYAIPAVSGTTGGSATVSGNGTTVVELGGRITVQVPAGVLPAGSTLTVEPASAPAAFPSGFAAGGVYAVTASGGALNGQASIEFAYTPDPASPLAEDKGFVVAYWNSSARRWVQVAHRVDTARKRLIVNTPHFSTWAYWRLQGYTSLTRYVDIGSGHYTAELYYHPAHTPPYAPGNGGGMAGFAQEIAGYVEEAYRRYRTAGLLPPDTLNVILDPSAGASEVVWYSGNMILSTDAGMNGPVTARHEVAHEMFHAIQGRSDLYASRLLRAWWMEATPDVAGAQVVMSGVSGFSLGAIQELRIVDPAYFLSSIASKSDADDWYRYGSFLDHLLRERNLAFATLWNDTEAQHLAVITSAQPGLAQLRALEGVVNAHAPARPMIDSYREFIGTQLTDPASGIERPALNALLATRTVSLPADASETWTSLAVAEAHAANFRRVTVALRTGASSRTVAVQTAAPLADAVSIDVYRLPGGRIASAPRLGTLAGNTTVLNGITLAAGDELLIIAVNGGTAIAAIDLSIRDAGAPAIGSLSPAQGAVGTSVTISGSGFGATPGSVSFNGVAATPASWSDTRITVAVPAGASTGPVVVRHATSGASSNGMSFTVSTPATTGVYHCTETTTSGPLACREYLQISATQATAIGQAICPATGTDGTQTWNTGNQWGAGACPRSGALGVCQGVSGYYGTYDAYTYSADLLAGAQSTCRGTWRNP